MKRPQVNWVSTLVVTLAFLLLIGITGVRLRFQQQPNALFVSDAFGYYIYLPSVVIDRDVDLSNQLARQPKMLEQSWHKQVPETGLHANAFMVGCALLWSFTFVLAHVAVVQLNGLGVPVAANGFGWAYEWPVYLTAFSIGLIGVCYIFRILREEFGATNAKVVTLFCTLASPLAAYLWFEPGMSHAASMCFIAMLVYYLRRAYLDHDLHWKTWARLGFLCGLIVSIRATDVIVGIAVAWVGIAVLLRETSTNGRGWDALLAIAVFHLVAVFCFLPQMLVWKTIYGHYITIPSGLNVGGQSATSNIVGFLFSASRGMFVWAPAWAIGIVGLVVGAVRGRAMMRCLLVTVTAAIYLSSSTPWVLGAAFGPRRLVDYSVIFAMGIGYALTRRPALGKRAWLWATFGVLTLFNWTLMVRYFTHELPEYHLRVEYSAESYREVYVDTVLYPIDIAAEFTRTGRIRVRESWFR